MDSSEYNFIVSGNAPSLYPVDTLFGLLWYSDSEAIEIPKQLPFAGEWGKALTTTLMINDEYPIPNKISLVYISLVEGSVYEIEAELPQSVIKLLLHSNSKEDSLYTHIVVGMAPYGHVAIWCYGYRKSTFVIWITGEKVEIDLSEYITNFQDIHKYCNNLISNSAAKEKILHNVLPPRDLFDNYMKQFTYRYQVIFERYDEDEEKWMKYDEEKNEIVPEFVYIEESLFDGTHDKLHDGGLMKYHEAGKPKKLALKWHIKKSEYSAYFWFDEDGIREVFDRFYGAHPDTKTDFIIRIDVEKNKYEVALYRYGLKDPQIVSENVYQLLVFKNKFEYYRSDNYSQERGAWIW